MTPHRRTAALTRQALSLSGAPTRDPHAPLARGCRPRGCRAPARRVLGRRVRYHIGSEPGQINGMRWRPEGAL
ncbi:tryptophan biosynthesis modulator TrpM [Streptomyces spiramyceticus]|uniref:tryptophan biosynthesis modulator TrpM n=1 Tax=Streptomyces spiramyceticus TaxID=299717 RepID=UPI00237B589C|nr:tryptophan synthase subunit(beta) [Streptomyces spiramyceticus]